MHKHAAVQKCTLLPTKPSLAAIPRVDPPFLVHLISLGVWAVLCSDVLGSIWGPPGCFPARLSPPSSSPPYCAGLLLRPTEIRPFWEKILVQVLQAATIFNICSPSSLLPGKGQVIPTRQAQHPGRRGSSCSRFCCPAMLAQVCRASTRVSFASPLLRCLPH